MHILALLDLKKMIPVIDGVYKKIDFDLLEEKKRDLYRKEYRYLLTKKDDVLRKAKDLYIKRVREHRKIKFCCDFNQLENYIRDISK